MAKSSKKNESNVKKRKQQPVAKRVQDSSPVKVRASKTTTSVTPNSRRDNPRIALPNPRRIQKQSRAYACFIGIIFILIGAALFLMLFTFTAVDLATDSETTLNLFGIIGAHIADIMLTLFGLAAFLFSAISLLMGICTLSGKQFEVHPSEFVGLCILLLGSSPLLHFAMSDQRVLDHLAGGIFGKWIAELALAHMPSWGLVVSGSVLSLFGALLVTDTRLKSFFLGIWHILRWIGKTLGCALAEPFKSPRALPNHGKTPETSDSLASLDDAHDSIFYEDTTSQLLDEKSSDLEEREALARAAMPPAPPEIEPLEPSSPTNPSGDVEPETPIVPSNDEPQVQDDIPPTPADEPQERDDPKAPPLDDEPKDEPRHHAEDIGDLVARIRKSNPKSRSIQKSHSAHALEPEFEFDSILPPDQLSQIPAQTSSERLETVDAPQKEQVKTSVLGNWKPRSIGRRSVPIHENPAMDATVALSEVRDEVAQKAATLPAPELPSHMTKDLLAQLATEEIELDDNTRIANKTRAREPQQVHAAPLERKAPKGRTWASPTAVGTHDDALSPELRALMDEFGFSAKKKPQSRAIPAATLLKPAPEAQTPPPETCARTIVPESKRDALLRSFDVDDKSVPTDENKTIAPRDNTLNPIDDIDDDPESLPSTSLALDSKPRLRDITNSRTSFVVAEEKKRVSEDELREAEAARRKKIGDDVAYQYPPLSLLHYDPATQKGFDHEALRAYANKIEEKLAEYHIQGQVVQICPGPIITRFEFQPAPGTKVARIQSLSDDLMMALEIASIRILAPIPGKGVVGIEIPNEKRNTIYLKEIIGSKPFIDAKSILTIALGKDSEGEPVVSDLAKMPHLLVAGSTGSGKSVAINTMLCSLLYNATPDEVKLILVDPKCLELSIYEGIPHLLVPPITTPKETAAALDWACDEMDDRYRKLAAFGVRNIAGYNEQIKNPTYPKSIEAMQLKDENGDPVYKPLPYIVIVVDEFADLMMTSGKEIERSIARLAQKARAAGIHIILATQRPSTNVITGVIKANFPTRIAFRVFSYVDSRTILDSKGAESLLGMGDSLFLPPNTGILQRVHGAYVSDEEVQSIVSFLSKQRAPEYNLDITTPKDDGDDDDDVSSPSSSHDFDPLYDQAVQIVAETRQASASYLQRKMSIGFNRAARIVEQMEREGVVGPQRGQKPREVLIEPL